MTNAGIKQERVPAVKADKPQTDVVRLLVTNRTVLLVILLVLVLAVFGVLSATAVITPGFNSDYLAGALINLVPLAMLALAETLVILSGRAGIDLSVGAVVSLAGMLFGVMFGMWGWPLWVAVVGSVLFGAVCGLCNGYLIAYFDYPPLIVTLATYYCLWSLALIVNDQKPINTKPLQDLYELSRSVEVPLIGKYLPLFPMGVLLFLAPTVVVVWFVIAKTTYGRELYAIGTNDVAASWAGINTRRVRMLAYVGAGSIAGLVAVVTASQFASARPDSGVSGNGMALPAITMAVLGGVAITGGIGTVLGVVLAALLVTWLNAGVLLAFSGNAGSQLQLAALGVVLVGAALLNGITNRHYSGTK